MKSNRSICITALLALLVALAACGAQRFPEPRPLSPADLETLALVPYANTDLSFASVVPDGWVEALPGMADDLFLSGPPGERPSTALIQRFEPNSTAKETLQRWLPLLSLDEAPERASSRASASFTWDLYPYEAKDVEMGLRRGVLALAETVDGAYMVALITQPDEYDALYEAVFLPAVDALAPVSDLPSRYEVYNAWPHVASIEAVGHSARETVDFRLETCTRLRVYAIGQLQGPSMVDYGFVEDATTGQIVWQMYPFETESAGYVQNRRADRPLTLPAGAYRLHYHSDASHAFDDWGDRPPSHRFWGISLFVDQEPGAPPPQCLPRAEQVGDLGWSADQLAQLGAEFADH
ncbi:MAG: hypothetical protein PVG54_15155, partial [Anaerolineae bacterium]